ncbi:MAG: amidohydrolase family protein [Chloroflexi bacterium]|nr:amidohydrolase family protein [Chloroflexota bacterium]
MEPGDGVRTGTDVLVRDGRIEAVGSDLSATGAEVIDARGMAVLPGLVETHFHMWSTLGRNFISEGFEYFPAKLATSAHYEPIDFYRSDLLGLVEAASAGITTVHDWSHNTRTPAHADAELRAHRDGLIRARYAYGHRDGLPADDVLDFADIDRVAAEWFGPGGVFGPGGASEGVVRLGVNLRGPALGSMASFDAEMVEARRRSLPVAIHTYQDRDPLVDATVLEERGYLGPDFLIAHFIGATDADIAAMARTGTPLSFAVHSELRLASAGDPRAALLRFLAAGIRVSFSIDASSLAPIDLFQAMDVAWNMGIPWEGSGTADLPALTFRRVLEIATIEGARSLGLGDVTGSLRPGKRADVIAVRLDDLNMAPAADVEGALVRCALPANVDTVVADGRVLKRGGELTAWDVRQVIRDAQESALAVRTRAGGRLAPTS